MILEVSFAAVSGFSVRDSATIFVYAILAALSIWSLTTYLFSPLRHFPGPFLAGKINGILP
jgi:hypothetical protein